MASYFRGILIHPNTYVYKHITQNNILLVYTKLKHFSK